MRYLIVSCCALLLLLSGCKTSPISDLSPEQSAHYSKIRHERKLEAEQLNIDEKAEFIQQRLYKQHLDPQTSLPKKYTSLKHPDGPINMELSTSYLAALAYQYACEPTTETRDRILKLVKGIQAADASNGYDGYLPSKLERVNGELRIVRNETHTNLYAMLLNAYTLTLEFVPDEAIRSNILEHMELIFAHYLKHDFKLYDEKGRKQPHSNIRISPLTFSPADRLDGTAFLTVATHYLPSTAPIYPQLLEQKAEADRVYKNVGPMHLDFGSWEIPNASSSWLALLSFDTICQIKPDSDQRARLLELAQVYNYQINPLFLSFIAKYDPQLRDSLIPVIQARLQEVPHRHLSVKMINSSRDDIRITTHHTIKRSRYPRSEKPLPLYELDSDGYLWKRDLMKIDASRSAGYTYPGIDYLHAYWQLRYVQQL